MIQAVLFDMDGVLLESEEYITKAGVEMFREKGYLVDPEAFLEFTGMGEDRFLGGVAEKYNIPFNVEKDKARTYDIYTKLVHNNIEALPGVFSFIKKCKEKKLKLALATSADSIKMRVNLEEIGLPEDMFDATVNGQDIKNKKPAPDIFIKAAEHIGIAIENCLVVEDAISGVKAGKSAGCKVLALTTSFSPEELHEADWIASNLAEALFLLNSI